MIKFINWYQNIAIKLHPVERAARVHIDFVKIHPFTDGNGRTSRLLMNLELMKAGYPATIIRIENRLRYYEALDKAHTTQNYNDFITLLMEVLEKSFQNYFYILGI